MPHLSAAGAVAHCDENTIGVVAVLGSTYDGSYEPVAEIAAALDRLQASTGLDVPMHVDAASGGFVAPFLDPDIVWDFRLPRVQSINASGHKYGLVYPGVGWAIWRDKAALPEDLIFEVDYLGGRDADVRAELLARWRPDRRPVLRADPPRPRRASVACSRTPATPPGGWRVRSRRSRRSG